jgi:hypothetical protein
MANAKQTAEVAESTVTIEMTLEKETKGAVRYADTTEGSVLPTLYVRKDAFEDGKFPQTITVTISA